MLRFLRILILTMSLGVIPYFTLLTHATSANRYYPIGTPTLQSIWIVGWPAITNLMELLVGVTITHHDSFWHQ